MRIEIQGYVEVSDGFARIDLRMNKTVVADLSFVAEPGAEVAAADTAGRSLAARLQVELDTLRCLEGKNR